MNDSNKQKPNTDYAVFLHDKPLLCPLPAPPSRLIRDLVSSKRRLASVYVLGSALGYLATLLICAQCSIGLTPLAWRTAAFMQDLDMTLCALFCGIIFGIGPFMASTIFLSRFEHRYLLFKMPWLVCAVPVIASFVMTLIGTPHPWTWHGIWSGAAIFTPYLLEGFAYLILRQNRWQERSNTASF